MKRFWDKVEKTETCWNWTGALSSNGHGRFNLDGKLVSPHRLSYEMAHGKISVGLNVCHHCDNRRCVKPDHLFLGTQSDNMKDAHKKGRVRVINRSTKLDRQAAQDIRSGNAIGMSQRELAKAFKISRSQVRRIISFSNWKN